MLANFAKSVGLKLNSSSNVAGTIFVNRNKFPLLSYARATYTKKVELGAISSLGKASKKKIGKLGPMMEKKVLPVEEDANKLVSHVCGSNIFKEGEDIKLKSDEEYPDWLWTLRTGKAPPLEEMDPESKEYWQRVRVMAMRRNNQLAKLKKF